MERQNRPWTAGEQVPNKEQVLALSEELRSRSKLPAHVPAVLKALAPGTHPMTQFSAAVLALQVLGLGPCPCFATSEHIQNISGDAECVMHLS